MKELHPFIFVPGLWLGEGKIQLSMVDEELGFFTRWGTSQKNAEGQIECIQEIQVKGLNEVMHNQFLLYDLACGNFSIELDNPALGRIKGSGIITESIIAWEFRSNDLGLEGFEFYEKQSDGGYLMRAEYATADQFRTLIKGKVWKQIEQPEQRQNGDDK